MTLTLLTFVRWLALAVGLAGLGLPARADTEFLPAAAAYKPQVSIANGQLLVRYEVAPGYYLYRSKLGFESATPGVTLGAPAFPVGEDHEDEYFGKQVIYRDTFAVAMPVSFDGPPRDFDLKLKLQGCADAGLCYPPLTWTRTVAAAGAAIAPAATGPAARRQRLRTRASASASCSAAVRRRRAASCRWTRRSHSRRRAAARTGSRCAGKSRTAITCTGTK